VKKIPKVITVGEMLVEVMRKDVDVSLGEPADFVGPFPSGAPAIFIDAVAKLGISAGIIGSVGRDEFGGCILERLGKDGVDTSMVKEIGELSTGVAFVAYSSDGSRKFIYHMGNSAAGAVDAGEIPKEYVESASVIHISGSSLAMGERMRGACYEAVRVGKESGVSISFDPNVRKELGIDKIREMFAPVFESCNLLTPSADELKEICGIGDEEKAAKEMVERGVDVVAVKDGKMGCRVYTGDGKVEARAFDVGEVDPTGAGDAFSAGIVVGWLEGMDPEELAVFANAVGGRAVTAKGPMEGLAWRNEIDKMIK
jgi:sugar/nucleoside kinase (ribokinase family)